MSQAFHLFMALFRMYPFMVPILSRFKRQQSYRSVALRHGWTPGLSQTPLLSTAALLLSTISIVFSAIVLAVSDGQVLSDWANHWRFSPTVYLSIASTITNITLHYALSDGLDVSWWRSALTSHTTVGDLHRTWAYGNSFFDAILSFRHTNLVAVACVIVTLTPFNGPLLQRASQVTTRDSPMPRELEVSIANQLPKNYTGYILGEGDQPDLYTSNFTAVVRDYYQQAPIRLKSECRTSCKANVLGAGWAVDCQSSAYPYNMTTNQMNVENVQAWAQIFGSDFQWDSSLPAVLQVGAQIKNTRGCLGNLLVRNCTLVAATVRYPVELTSNSASLATGTTIWDDDIVGPLFNGSFYEDLRLNDHKTTYGCMSRALHNRFGSFMLILWQGTVEYNLEQEGELATAYVRHNQAKPNCDMTFDDPMDDMLAGARELMFRSAVSAGSFNSSNRQAISATETGAQNVYKSQYLFLGLATMLSSLGILFVTMTFNGFWQLGRRVTLSPIETAKAFNAPLLSNNDSNAPMRSLLDELSMRPVRYGAVVADTTSLRKRKGSRSSPEEPLTLPTITMPASTDFEFSDHIPGDDARLPDHLQTEAEKKGNVPLRLELADPEFTQPPVVGAHYVGS